LHAAVSPSKVGPAFLWNIDGPVGLNGANIFDDVLFVQWCFYKLGQYGRMPADLRAICAQTPVNGSCTGREGDALIASIKALQRFDAGAIVDGRVSPLAKDAIYNHRGERHQLVIVLLNGILRNMYPQLYPRIDLMPEFVWRIKDKATAPFI
jgi:hypothetical protein